MRFMRTLCWFIYAFNSKGPWYRTLSIYCRFIDKGSGLVLVRLYKETVEMWTAFIFVILVTFKIVIDMGVVDRFCSNKR